jgi:hypothetical protein
VNAGLLTVFFALGAGAIALWFDARFPRLAPQALVKALIHVIASTAVAYASGYAMQGLFASEEPRIIFAAAFGLGLPSIIYCLLAGVWVIKVTQRAMSGYLH